MYTTINVCMHVYCPLTKVLEYHHWFAGKLQVQVIKLKSIWIKSIWRHTCIWRNVCHCVSERIYPTPCSWIRQGNEMYHTSVVEHPLIVWWIVGSIHHDGVIQLFLWSITNKGRGMCYHVCRMMHTKDLMLLIGEEPMKTRRLISCLAIWVVF